MPPYALPEEDRLEAEGLERDAPVDALGRFADGVPVDGRAPAVPVEGRAPAAPVEGRAPAVPVDGRAPLAPVEGRAPPESQPRACALRAEVVALGEPLSATTWIVRLYHKPYITWIWGGCLMMGIGGFLAAFDRRYRVKARAAQDARLGGLGPAPSAAG